MRRLHTGVYDCIVRTVSKHMIICDRIEGKNTYRINISLMGGEEGGGVPVTYLLGFFSFKHRVENRFYKELYNGFKKINIFSLRKQYVYCCK